MKVLQLTAHFKPNIGGVETHLDDLVNALLIRGWLVMVLTYRPLTTSAKWQIYESKGDISIIRIPWLPYFFYSLISVPLLEFLYLLPGLLLVTPFVLLTKNPDVIHAHGLVAGFVGVFWGKLFGKRVIISTHSIYFPKEKSSTVYSFPNKGLYKSFVRWIFNNADFSMGLSNQAVDEIKSLGIPTKKVGKFTYWIDLERFRKISNAKKLLGWKDVFVVLFVGRVIEEKGINELLDAANTWDKEINLKICGGGPLEEKVINRAKKLKNIQFVGKISQSKLPAYYSASDILIVPSISEEGFGRVILEALACGTPVIGANRGAIPEAMDETVGRFIKVNPANIKGAVEYLYTHPMELKKLARNSREFAERRYSEKNIETIIKAYTG